MIRKHDSSILKLLLLELFLDRLENHYVSRATREDYPLKNHSSGFLHVHHIEQKNVNEHLFS
jgi:hypothetical protein